MKAQSLLADLIQTQRLNDNTLEIILKPTEPFSYQAGQYLQLFLGEEPLYFSIANAPSETIELHLRHNSNNQALFEAILHEKKLSLALPFGSCHVERLASNKPILFLAGGTGFAPIKAMIEHLIASKDPRHFELFWAAREASGHYLDKQVKHWASS